MIPNVVVLQLMDRVKQIRIPHPSQSKILGVLFKIHRFGSLDSSNPYPKAPSGIGSADPIIKDVIEKVVVGAAVYDRKLLG